VGGLVHKQELSENATGVYVCVCEGRGQGGGQEGGHKARRRFTFTRQIVHTRCSEEHTTGCGPRSPLPIQHTPAHTPAHTGTPTQPYTTQHTPALHRLLTLVVEKPSIPLHYTAHSSAPQTAHISGGEAKPGQLGAEGQGKVHLAHHSWHATGCHMQQHTGHDLAVTHGRGAVVHYRHLGPLPSHGHHRTRQHHDRALGSAALEDAQVLHGSQAQWEQQRVERFKPPPPCASTTRSEALSGCSAQQRVLACMPAHG
jgi:hypothetical protein